MLSKLKVLEAELFSNGVVHFVDRATMKIYTISEEEYNSKIDKKRQNPLPHY